MRTILLVFTVALGIEAGASLGAATPAQAGVFYPVCLQWRYNYNDCRYTSFEACAATASGIGATCQINPAYVEAVQSQPARRRKAQRYYREY